MSAASAVESSRGSSNSVRLHAVSQHERGYLRHITQGCLGASIDCGKRYSRARHHLVGSVAVDASGQREIGDGVEDLIGDAGTQEAKPRVP